MRRLVPLDLSPAELAERRRIASGVVALLSNGVAVQVREVTMLSDELVGYVGVVLPCVLGVDELPVGELVTFEASHVEQTFAPWRWLELAERGRRRRERRSALRGLGQTVESIRTHGAFVAAYSRSGRLGHVRDPLD